MRFIDLQIEGFGKLNNTRILFSEGTNLISGHNEAGKSTVYACLKAMLFGMERAKGVAALTDTYSHYKPWFAKSYGASLRLENGGHVYCIKRDFLKDPVGCSVFDETAMEAVPYGDRFVAELILDMSEEIYDNTVSISKLRPDGSGNLSGGLKKYIVNMDTTGSQALNCTRARAYLNDQKKKLVEGISPEAAKEYAVNCSEIKRLEKTIRESDAVTRIVPATILNAAASAENTLKTAENAENKRPEAADPETEPGKTLDTENSAEELKSLMETKASLTTDIQLLDAQIIEERELLRNHSVYSSEQVREALGEFDDELKKYSTGSEKKASVVFRVLYIVFFVLTVLAVLATAFICGSNYKRIVLLGSTGIGVLCLVLGIAFLILCIISKNNYSKKAEEFGRFLERYTGYNDVSRDRIDRVKSKLEELLHVVADVESKEIELAQLTQQAAEIEAEIKEKEIEAQTREQAREKEELAAIKEDGAELKGSEGAQANAAAVNDAINRINALKAANIGLKELLKKNDAINEEIDAIDLALEKMDELADTMKDSLGVHLNARASEYIKEITKGAYDSLSVDDELNVFLNTKDKMVPIEQVSNGTADQIYMALRLAGARLVQNDSDGLPLLFDDSFVNYDDERLSATLSWLVNSYKGQVVLFSCQSREERILEENNLTFNPIHL